MAQTKFRVLKRPSKWRWARRFLYGAIILMFVGLGLLRWLVGPRLQEIYTRKMQVQLSWYEPRYPTLKPLWALAKLPMVAVEQGDRALLLPPGTDDRFDPTAELAKDLPAKTLASYLVGAKDGDVIILPAGRYTDCMTIDVPKLTLRSQQPGAAQLDGGACSGKATIVARGQSLVIDGLVFKNVRVPDGNGAGIRLEAGELHIKNSIFYNSENAILTISQGDSKLLVEDSLFVRLGRCDGLFACAHSIYAGQIASVIIRKSVFKYGAGGHFIKSRAKYTEITDTLLDGTRGNAAFLIDLPNGSDGIIADNHFIKGKASSNRCCIIRIGAEGKIHNSSGLSITNNQVYSQIPLTVFVWNDSEDRVLITDNALEFSIKSTWGKSRNN
jgi:hypothetical protein